MVDCQYTPARMYMEIVNRRDQNSLVDILNQRLEANSVIHSDKSRAYLNTLSANPTKWSNTLKQFVGCSNCLSVFDHFVGLALSKVNKPYISLLMFKLNKSFCYNFCDNLR